MNAERVKGAIHVPAGGRTLYPRPTWTSNFAASWRGSQSARSLPFTWETTNPCARGWKSYSPRTSWGGS